MMDWLQLLAFILPAYVSNGIPVLFPGRTPIDLGQKHDDGNRFFGPGKTIRGFIAGVLVGTLSGVLLAWIWPAFLPVLSFNEKAELSFLLAFGAMAGDLLGSFLKRRLHVPPGAKIRFLDQIPFVVIALQLALLAFPQLASAIGLWGFAFLIVFTVIIHRVVNFIAFKAGLKRVPW
ncbi:CDP-2,3-bis-(O-geranylgeranyl)-sn-glycerol synthase [Candidatus Micrarchaeota archaeon]|nr:CDP-2,3-bis-(O-geranylgeranyl)-sn-glycerol synthase [Candidatus Micrarchaeota archaeon]